MWHSFGTLYDLDWECAELEALRAYIDEPRPGLEQAPAVDPDSQYLPPFHGEHSDVRERQERLRDYRAKIQARRALGRAERREREKEATRPAPSSLPPNVISLAQRRERTYSLQTYLALRARVNALFLGPPLAPMPFPFACDHCGRYCQITSQKPRFTLQHALPHCEAWNAIGFSALIQSPP